ncbi:MAG: queuosine precursor transporter [Flavobacteriaceae bacterium]
MSLKQKLLAHQIYLILATLFITALVVSNLIFQKFFTWNPFGWYHFELSVGILPYPITFIITDIISEIYGKKKANKVVIAGIFASLFALLIIIVADGAPATQWSPVGDDMYHKVFGFSAIAVFSSMMAYLVAQFIDIKIFHFWKKLTKGKHLWMRNNFSTISSQFLDTFTVLVLLCSFEVIEWNLFGKLLINGYLFKVLIALIDTPLIYAAVYYFRKKFNLKVGEEISFID